MAAPLRWFDTAACVETWKRVRPHIADARVFYLSDCPGETAALASEWAGRLDERLIVLEWLH